jgi:DNA polymerase-4
MRTLSSSSHWPRAIILVDMNAFFASIEQHDFPELRGRPVAVTNGKVGTCIITSSYEARAYGVKTGMRLKEAKLLCPDLFVIPSHPYRYAEVSSQIMNALNEITPDIEIFSIDEAFLDVTHCQKLWGPPEKIGRMAKQKVLEVSGLLCSVGVSGDKTTAKYAANLYKPNGLCIIPPWEAKEKLASVRVTELCGIGEGIGNFLKKYGVRYCGDMQKLPISIIGQRFGPLGKRIWLMCQGLDPDAVKTTIDAPKSMGHGKVMPPNTRDKKTLLEYLCHMAEKLAARLRRHHLQAKHFFIGWKNREIGWLGYKGNLSFPSNDGKEIYQLGEKILNEVWAGQPIYQIQVTALDPQIENIQKDLFGSPENSRVQLNNMIDKINQKYGAYMISPAPLLYRSKMHNVISPAWKPMGHRQSL